MSAALDIFPCTPGETVHVQAVVHAKVTARTAELQIQWLSSVGGNVGSPVTVQSAASDTTASTGTTLSGSATAPAGADYGENTDHLPPTTASSEVHQVDCVGEWVSAPSAWSLGVSANVGRNSLPSLAAVSVSEYQADYVGNGSWEDILADDGVGGDVADHRGDLALDDERHRRTVQHPACLPGAQRLDPRSEHLRLGLVEHR